jgi:D-aminopeptidase
MRARELGITIGSGTPGQRNAITDVEGVRVGHATLIEGDAVRTGVTVVIPHDGDLLRDPLFAGTHRLNGNGEMTGTHWIREAGLLASPLAITNTHSVGVVRDALVEHLVAGAPADELVWAIPVVAETYDGCLNDINGFHVRAEHVRQAISAASPGPVAEGSVGGGTGMICHGFKGGIGTSSRVTAAAAGGHTVGVLVQANHGRREQLRVNGTPVGERLDAIPQPELTAAGPGDGSIIVLVACDAPLLPGQCDRLAQRAALGIARMGGTGENSSGDLMLCFATGNRGLRAVLDGERPVPLSMLPHACIDALFDAVVDATQEAILNAMLASPTMHGRGGSTVHGLDPQLLREAMAGG